MKTIGLLGGMSWESTALYYQIINETVKAALGGLHSAKIVLHSVDFAEVEALQAAEDWDASARLLTEAAKGLEAAGAQLMAICTNTMHRVAPQVQAGIEVPLVHIADATAGVLRQRGIERVGLLGTKYTMTQAFYRARIEAAGIAVVLPGPADIALVNRVIYDELCLGTVSDASRQDYLRVMDGMRHAGAQGVILGCTEIGLLIRQADTDLPVFDTARIHARQIALAALNG